MMDERTVIVFVFLFNIWTTKHVNCQPLTVPACDPDYRPLLLNTRDGDLQFTLNQTRQRCEWFIDPAQVQPDEHLAVVFSHMELVGPMLVVMEHPSKIILGRYFHPVNPPPILLSNSTSVLVSLSSQSDESYNAQFQLSYHLTSNPYAVTACNENSRPATIYDLQSPVMSPNYPNPFPANAVCIWRLVAPENHIIRLDVKDIFIGYCTSNRLSIYAADDYGSTLNIASTCQLLDSPIYVPTNIVYFSFKSGYSGYRGFEIQHAILPTAEVACSSHLQPAILSLSGRITSPDEDGFYPAQIACKWQLRASLHEVIVITFELFDLDNECNRAHLNIYDSFNRIGEVERLHKCGLNYLPPLTINNDLVNIEFRVNADPDEVKHGFKADFQLINKTAQACSQQAMVLKSSPGYIVSPNYGAGNLYPTLATCRWQISGTHNEIVTVFFEDMDMSSQGKLNKTPTYGSDRHLCSSSNSLSFYDGYMSEFDPLLGRYCDNVMPDSLSSSTHHLYIIFKSTYDRKPGFKLIYELVDKLPSTPAKETGHMTIGGVVGLVLGVIASLAVVASGLVFYTKYRKQQRRDQQQQCGEPHDYQDAGLWNSDMRASEVDFSMTNAALSEFPRPPDYPPEYPCDENAPPSYHEATSTRHSLVGSAALSNTPAPVLPTHIHPPNNSGSLSAPANFPLPPSYNESKKVCGTDQIIDAHAQWTQYDGIRIQQDDARVRQSHDQPCDEVETEV